MSKILKVRIGKNLLTEVPNDYTAVVSINGSVGMNKIVDELVEEGMEIKRETVIDIFTRFTRKTATGKTDGTLAKRRNAELKSWYLKIAGDNPDCEVNLRNIATQDITKLATGDMVVNKHPFYSFLFR